jgi:hypothetical protein
MVMMAVKAPTAAPSRAKPRTELERARSRWTAGMRESQLETRIPWIRKTTATEMRADFSRSGLES